MNKIFELKTVFFKVICMTPWHCYKVQCSSTYKNRFPIRLMAIQLSDVTPNNGSVNLPNNNIKGGERERTPNIYGTTVTTTSVENVPSRPTRTSAGPTSILTDKL